MAPGSQEDPRANQKARTRAAIVEAAQLLQGAGETPTVAQAAEQAGVSRATAYRYFPTQEALLVEISAITPGVASIEALLDRLETDDVEQRLLFLLDNANSTALAEEAHYRTALWVYLDTWLRSRREAGGEPPAVREGRRMRWLDKALEPLGELPDERRRRLECALALTLGIDSLVIMKDVCHLEDDEALDVLRWVAGVLLRAGLEREPAGSSR
jgi:AcrR family transcriptional regulator